MARFVNTANTDNTSGTTPALPATSLTGGNLIVAVIRSNIARRPPVANPFAAKTSGRRSVRISRQPIQYITRSPMKTRPNMTP